MKFKIFVLFVLFASVFLFFGCKPQSDSVDVLDSDADTKNIINKISFSPSYAMNIQKQTVNVKNSGSVYLVKINTGTKEFTAETTGRIERVSSRKRNVADAQRQAFSESASAQEEILPQIKNDIRLYNEFTENYKNLGINPVASARTASQECAVIKEQNAVGDKKQFFLEDWKKQEAVCKYVGEHCDVWFIDNSPSVVKEDDFNDETENKKCSFKTLAQVFDKIYELEESVCGSHIFTAKSSADYINPHDKITIIVADLMNDASENQRHGIYGYFRPSDILMNVSDANANQIIYVDSHFYQNNPVAVYSTIVHEYSHLLNYVVKVIVNGRDIDLWFTEMLAMTLEDMFMDYLDIDYYSSPLSRLTYFNNGSFYGISNWDATSEDDLTVYYSYGNAYVMGAALARNFGGIDFVRELSTSPYVDSEAINQAFIKFNSTYKNEAGETLQYDFDKFIRSIFKVCFNLGADLGPEYLSLNKSAGSPEDDLHFNAIDLAQAKYINSFYGIEMTSAPLIYRSEVQTPLGGYGFSIHYVGTDIKSYVISTPWSSDIEYYSLEFAAASE